MKLTELWRTRGKPTISFELFPPRTPKAAVSQEKAISKLAELEPEFVSVTFGAGGSHRQGSFELVEKLMARQLETLAYFACWGLGPEDITQVMDRYRSLGVESILAVRGDEPEGDDVPVPHPESLPHASDLLALLRSRYDFCLGAAGYPEGHREAPSREQDLAYLRLKVAQGADFIVTQYCYDTQVHVDFLSTVRGMGIEVPIVAGVMPIFSVKVMESMAQLCGATITAELREGLAALPPDDKEALAAFGIDFAVRQCRELLRAGVAGLHFYTLNRSAASLGIVQRLREEGAL